MAFVPDLADKRCDELSGNEWKCYTLFCRMADKQGVCWPSLDTIARERNWKKSHACEYRNGLAAKGWIRLSGDEVQCVVGFLSHSENGNESFRKSESSVPDSGMNRSENGNSYSENRNGYSENGNESFRKSEWHIRKNQPIEPAHLTSPLNQPIEPARERADEVTLSDALMALFPQLESLHREMQAMQRECVALCLRLKVTPDKVPKWREWLLDKWPLSNANPKKFLETLNQFLQEESNASSGRHRQSDRSGNANGIPQHDADRFDATEF